MIVPNDTTPDDDGGDSSAALPGDASPAVDDIPPAPGPSYDTPERVPFERLKPAIGTVLRITRLNGEGADFSADNALVGYLADRFLIVSMPASCPAGGWRAGTDSVSVHFYLGRSRYSFESIVDAVFPGLYLHLSFPREVVATPVRDAPRVRIRLTARIEWAGSSRDVTVIDLSVHGARIASRSDAPMPLVGTDVRLGFMLVTGGDLPIRERFAVDARVIDAAPPANAGEPAGHEAVLRFTTLDERESLHLTNLVMARILESGENLL